MSSFRHGDSAIRAGQLESSLQALSLLGEDEQLIRRRLSREMLGEVEDALRISWLPVRFDLELSTAVMEVCGLRQLRRWARESILLSAQAPLLGPVLRGLRSAGLTPLRALGRVPMVWDLLYRACGHFELQSSAQNPAEEEAWAKNATHLTLLHREAPSTFFEPAMTEGFAGAFAGVVELAVPENAVVVDVELDREANLVSYHCAWSVEASESPAGR